MRRKIGEKSKKESPTVVVEGENAVTTKLRAHGKWRGILPVLGISLTLLNGKHQACPLCGGKDRFRFDDKRGDGDFFCNQCGAGSGFKLLMGVHGWNFAEAARQVDTALGHTREYKPPKPYNRALMTDGQAGDLWASARILRDGDPVTNYLLVGRGINELPHWPIALRFMDRYWHSTSHQYLPCMFALYQAPDGLFGTIHRTYLADVTPNKMFLPRSVPPGGAIRLFEPAHTMGVAEGIETALSAALILKIPVWATMSERLLRRWQPPTRAKRIVVFGDNDENFVGQSAAYELASRLVLRQGCEVKVLIPQNRGRDWNDVLRDNVLSEILYAKEQFAGQPVSDTN
jgi:putative DNA primase/helicase